MTQTDPDLTIQTDPRPFFYLNGMVYIWRRGVLPVLPGSAPELRSTTSIRFEQAAIMLYAVLHSYSKPCLKS